MECSICEREFDPEVENGFLPFCSERCKLIDRRRWLDEEYGLPFIPEDRPDEEFPEEPDEEQS